MFQFLHGYTPESWNGMVKNGLVGDHDGIRVCHCIMNKESDKFNAIARKDGPLYHILKERRCPFYIDRIQGGGYIHEYPYDMALINEYKEMLGDNFWGFQMHEWLSNYASDLNWKLGELSDEEWNEENIRRVLNRKFPGPNLFLEAMTLQEIASFPRPKNIDEYLHNMFYIYKKRMQTGDLIPCDSFSLAYKFELDAGSKRLMPEVGAQTPDSRFQICYARGMTRKSGLSFGVYYEPWGGKPFSTCTYFGAKDEWGVCDDEFFIFRPAGPNGGSSRSLQKRVYLYGYLSNAAFMSEEWGLYNTFQEGTDYELSPYGVTKKSFLNFARKYTDVGQKLTPIAAVLPAELPAVTDWDKPYVICGYTTENERMANAKRGINALFMPSTPMIGTETRNLKNSDMPDAIDILNRDDEMLKKYDYLVDFTSDADFAAAHPNTCEIRDIPDILRKLLPCYVEGGLHWLVNERTGGGYYLTVFNHSGVVRTVEEGEYTLPEADASVTVTFKENVSPSLLEGDGSIMKDGEMYRVSVPAGGFAFIAF